MKMESLTGDVLAYLIRLGFSEQTLVTGMKILIRLCLLSRRMCSIVGGIMGSYQKLPVKIENEISFTCLEKCYSLRSLRPNQSVTRLSAFPLLERLDLTNNNRLSDSDITQLSSLTNLNLSGNNTITDISQLTQLKTLNLSDNRRITDEVLMCLTNLTELNLCRNRQITMRSLGRLPLLKRVVTVNFL
jgi:Leucine-rich repeat (LRR) protein